MKFNGLACSQENGETRLMCLCIKPGDKNVCELKIPEMQVSAKLQSSNRMIFLNKCHAAEKNGKIHAARPPTVFHRRASEIIVLLLDCSFAESCISRILSSQKCFPQSFMHKHVDHRLRLSVFLRARQPVKFHDTSSYQGGLAILLISLCLLL